MNEIPKDIRDTALRLSAGANMDRDELATNIAEALMAEREQALAHLMANKLLDHMLDAILDGPQMRAMMDNLRDKS
jgi:hypothetical protein